MKKQWLLVIFSRKFALTLSIIFGLLYLGLFILLRFEQKRLIFFPTQVIKATPKDVGLPYEKVLISLFNEQIYGWWIPNKNHQDKTLLYLHGNGSNIGDGIEKVLLFHQLGWSILTIDYRGYGYSKGAFPTENSVYEDVEAAWNYLTKTRKIIPSNIIVYGHSLGGAIAIELAVKHPEMAGVIVESSFTSIKEMAKIHNYQIFPLDLLITQHFDSISKVKSLKTPILFIHGKADQKVPFQMSQKLFAATVSSKQILLIPNANHTNSSQLEREKYVKAIEYFKELSYE